MPNFDPNLSWSARHVLRTWTGDSVCIVQKRSTPFARAVQRLARPVGADPDFAKYFAKYALPARREKFPEISPVRLM